ncbi:hypothetical protein GN330_12215 [Nitratireductor sp. CAU 1489]|uniref:Uncharacterized protein n=1 Tax=Nitratireductor arenosus TaxID=2682096 RepID=A0A844QK02_9HYPH|nr:hypothetical protein [Nitratireductor arenosus]MVA98009.1 hypothetical protein [Nitratireductor arenosus]
MRSLTTNDEHGGRAVTVRGPHRSGLEDDIDEDAACPPRPLGPIEVDWRLFEHHLADSDLSEDQKREFIEALWYIIITFVDLGFGIEPVQQAMRLAAASSNEEDAATQKESGPGAAFGKTGGDREAGHNQQAGHNKEEGDDPGGNTS